MRMDLTAPLEDVDIEPASGEEDDDDNHMQPVSAMAHRRWIAHPKALRLSTRPRPPINPDGTRSRTFTRISKTGMMPGYIFGLSQSVEDLAEKLVEEALMPLFRKLHPEKSGWNLSLVNICATSMSLTASDGKDGAGRDIERMFRRQVDTLKEWKFEDVNVSPSDKECGDHRHDMEVLDDNDGSFPYDQPLRYPTLGSEELRFFRDHSSSDDDGWDSDNDMQDQGECCQVCGAVMPAFAMLAHERFHVLPD
ncbi:hypothetical protein P7C71_g2586, partial [Lecanoromycetidae sp. Uapishka_2]